MLRHFHITRVKCLFGKDRDDHCELAVKFFLGDKPGSNKPALFRITKPAAGVRTFYDSQPLPAWAEELHDHSEAIIALARDLKVGESVTLTLP